MTTTNPIRRDSIRFDDDAAHAIPSELREQIDATIYAAPKGTYQRGLLTGRESWSGSTLKGKAREYGARYAASRAGLLTRINRAAAGAFETYTAIDAATRRRVLVVEVDGLPIRWIDV